MNDTVKPISDEGILQIKMYLSPVTLPTMSETVALLARIRAQDLEIERLRGVLTGIAAFDDIGAELQLAETGRYNRFDEPRAVEAARVALSPKQEGE